MKRRDLVKLLKRNGWKLARHGSGHDIYKRNDDEEQVPRHREIKETTAKAIMKRWRLK
ncbi:MAG: type II toxin-antitoxin system HicA family toxin [Clostridiales Family XIII bacterium]|jgi:mRNA interferase HicA|nr:type II toxin-antitoxin system HicA family toxin [Clostridiales Family XIII bacterium]